LHKREALKGKRRKGKERKGKEKGQIQWSNLSRRKEVSPNITWGKNSINIEMRG
jgi:hypothetical protein